MPQTPEAVIKTLKNKQYAPLYFLQGEESYYIDLIADFIEKYVLNESERDFNQTILYGKEVDMNTIILHAKRFPMMAEKQVIIVKEAQSIQDINKEAGQKILESYTKNATQSTILVFCYKYKTLDARKSLTKTLDKEAILVTSKKLYENQIPQWIENYIIQKGHHITPKGTYLLTSYIGNSLERIASEVEKILVNFDEKTEINDSIIERYVGISKEYNVFELQKALTARDIMKANMIVNYFASNTKNHPVIPVIAMLFTFYSKLLIVHQQKDKGAKNLAAVLKINPYFVKDYTTAARNYTLTKVIDNIHYLRIADQQVKGINSSTDDGQILKELIFKVLHDIS